MANTPRTITFKVDYSAIKRSIHLIHSAMGLYDNTPIYRELIKEVCKHGRIASIACYDCCETCNLDEHRCHFCGDPLRHNRTDLKTGLEHSCYADAREDDERTRWELDRLGSSNT